MQGTAGSKIARLGHVEVPSYRAMVIGSKRAFVGTIPLAAESDDQAIMLAKALADHHAVELWDGLRFIEHFLPVD